MNKTKIVQNLPVKRSEISCPLQTADGRNVLGLAKEAHSNIVPQWRRLGYGLGGNFVLGERDIKVLMCLHHGARSEDGAGVLGIKGKSCSQTFKCCLMVSNLNVKQT